MKALCWHGKHDIRYETVPDPKIEHPRDAIIKTTCCAICGSDLHFFDGFVPGMKSGDVVGHEFMGEVVEVGSENKKLKVGDRVVVPFTICCGECDQCKRGNFSVCERTNRAFAIECKFQGSEGTVDEKIPYALDDLRALPMAACISYAGNGFSAGVLHMLGASSRAAYCLPRLDQVDDSADTRELDHLLATHFGWWDILVGRRKPVLADPA